MFENGRKNICVILCDVAAHYQEQVCRTLTSYAQIKGYNLSYFTFFLCYGVHTKNGKGEANIINLIPYEKYDGFIICHDTFQNQDAAKQVFRYLEEKSSAPVVTLRRKWGNYPCILAENKGAIKTIVHHFTDVHGFQRIAFMSGPKEHPDAQSRLIDYREALESRGIPYDESKVFYGNFWRDCAKEAARFFAMDLPERPQAIVCANDYMAIALCNELINIGTMVPEDIAVSGFDDIWETTINMPPITTVAMPVEEMAEKAFLTLEKMMNGEDVPQVQCLTNQTKIRNSCGCSGMDMNTMMKKRVRQSQEHERMLDLVQNNTYMFVEMSDVDNAQELVDHMRLLEREDNFVRNCFICLGEGRGLSYPKYCSNRLGYPKRSKAIGSVMNRHVISTDSYETKMLLPAEAQEREPMIYYFFPLHNLDHTFGYFAVSYRGVHSCEKTFHSWIAILGNALENLRLKQKTHSLLAELNMLYLHDPLTGLMNRRGFENSCAEQYRISKERKQTMVIISIDMDNLKVVNDKFGHMQGDVALKTIAKAIDNAASDEDVSCRIGGDEFAVVSSNYDDDRAQEFLNDFHGYLSKFNSESGLPYLVCASCGYCLISEEHEISLEAAIVESDNRLYEVKKEKKAKKLDIVLRDDEL